MILDGSGQVSYLNMMIAHGGFGRVYYEGGQKLKRLKVNAMFAGEFELRELPPGWTFTANGFSNISGRPRPTRGRRRGPSWRDQRGQGEIKGVRDQRQQRSKQRSKGSGVFD